MEAYLDNSATTRCSERAKDLMVQILTEDFGNPSSLHNKGKEAEDYIKEAKSRIAKTLRVDEKEIVFTSGGTESNNMALIGAALANKRQGMHIITTEIEHASVHAPLAYLAELGFEITYLDVDADGLISLEKLQDAVREDTVLVSVMMVNNEIGAVEPIEEAAALGEAAAEIYEDFDAKVAHMYALKERFIEGITQIPGVTVNGRTGRDSAPQIVSITIDDVPSEVMLHSLEEYGIYVSAGSACSSNKPAPSRTLQGIGLSPKKLGSTIRISFSVYTTEKEVDYAVEKMKEIIPFRRKFIRK